MLSLTVCALVLPPTSLLGADEEKDIPSYKEINELLGIPLFADDNLWDDPVDAIAKRLDYKKESETSYSARYRHAASKLFKQASPTQILSARDNLPEELLVLFLNKGDNLPSRPDRFEYGNRSAFRDALKRYEELFEKFQKRMSKQDETITESLTTRLGKNDSSRFGTGDKTRERVNIWFWNNTAFILSFQEGETLSLRVTTREMAENKGKVDHLRASELRKALKGRVEKRENGDVLITDLPMIEQGNKGYCVPATWARVFRYYMIPADEYTLANAADTSEGGGTSILEMVESVKAMARRYRCDIKDIKCDTTIRKLKDYIDDGIPIMWAMYSVPPFTGEGLKADRMNGIDPKEWKKQVKTRSKHFKETISVNFEKGHMCLIIGYNKETGEIATSDSWNSDHAEKWFPEEALEIVTMHDHFILER